MPFPSLLLVLLGLLALGFLVLFFRHSSSLNKKGYCFRVVKGTWHFEEMVDGVIRSAPLCDYEGGPEPSLPIPDIARWKAQVPEWAADRREEIFRKLEPGRHYFIIHPSDWNFTPEELEKKKADEAEGAANMAKMRKDLRIGDPDSPWQEEISPDGVSHFSRKAGM